VIAIDLEVFAGHVPEGQRGIAKPRENLMVPSWRFCMRGAEAPDPSSVRIKIWVAVCTIAT
jgi:hypothetical protein